MMALWLWWSLLWMACTTEPTHADNTHEEETLYTCGMHPHVVESAPGSCPLCGMDLTPMQERGPTTAVEISPGIIQQVGVETAPVTRTTVSRQVRTIGEVEVGEDQISVVNLRFSGWVEDLRVDNTGDAVRKGQVLFEAYSPELVAAQEDYLRALKNQGSEAPITVSARRRLELWNLDKRDLDALAAEGVTRRTLPIRSPINGFVLHKNIVDGARVQAGQDLYRIGNLTKIWVTAEIYEHDSPWIEIGQQAQAELTHLPGEVLEGRVAYVYPTLNPGSRTLSVRLEFDNPGVRLKPGMFSTVYIQYRQLEDVLAIPSEAILQSGRRNLAFVSLGEGRFEPRELTTGLVGDGRLVQVVDGLKEGEVVVTSGQFLLDSESQLQEALNKLMAGAAGPTEAKKEPPPPPRPQKALDAEVMAKMDAVLTDYEALRLALAEDRLDDVASLAGRLQASVGAATPAAPEEVSSRLNQMATAASALITGGTADEQRKTFGDLSEAVVVVLYEYAALSEGRFIFQCPMAQGYEKWVQTSEQLENPYMGGRMLRCGTPTEWSP